jgi:DNA-binding SARP family transcriptional activator
MGAEAAAANLRKAVHHARRGLGGKDSINSQGEMVVLWPAGELRVDAQHVDTQHLEVEAKIALAAGAGIEVVLERFTGDLLPEDCSAECTGRIASGCATVT